MKSRARISRRVRAALGGALTAGVLVGGATQAQAADFVKSDLDFILAQIKISEAHAAGAPLHTPDNPFTPVDEAANSLVPNVTLPYGVRTVDGRDNNLQPGQRDFGAADTLFPRLTAPLFRASDPFDPDGPGPIPPSVSYDSGSTVVDKAPRQVSNLIVDQTSANPSATEAFAQNDRPSKAIVDDNEPGTDLYFLPNKATDEGLSASYNSWFTLFGQFFDHGLDLVTKGGNGTVMIPLQPDDPLYNADLDGPDNILDDPATPAAESLDDPVNMMILTRAKQFDAARSTQNTTTPFIDQNQTYTSHPSHQVFLRQHARIADASVAGGQRTVATGLFLDDVNHGLATWNDIKAQSLSHLGIQLTDRDVLNVPQLRTDAYGRLLTGPDRGFAMYNTGTVAAPTWVEADGSLLPRNALGQPQFVQIGHAFLDDIAHVAAPEGDLDGSAATRPRGPLEADPDTNLGITDGQKPLGVAPQYYDDELLGRHFITGDGRGNENIGLTAVHFVFHAEHNRLAEQVKDVVLESAQAIAADDATAGAAYLNEWLRVDLAAVPAGSVGDNPLLEWDGERIFQAARFGTEMQYQHLVFEEFGRKIQPEIDIFTGYETDIDPKIAAEFAHTVYRFGHSMLNESVPRTSPLNVSSDIGLIEAFLNPVEFDADYPGATPGTTDPKKAAGAIIRGTTRQVGNELDEFITGALRNNLVGLPLDLGALNLARGRDTGIPGLNGARREFFAATAHPLLRPYVSWEDFGLALRHPESLVNFIAAYGTHQSIIAATDGAAKRAAAYALVYGNAGADGNLGTDADAPTVPVPDDRSAFMRGTDAYSTVPVFDQDGNEIVRNQADIDGVTRTGLGNVDFWVGGLAERQMPFGGLLGSTFNYVFESQMEKLQDGDRFYYLHRTAGLNFLTALEENSFSKIIAQNTDAKHLPLDVFSRPDLIFEVGQLHGNGSTPITDEPSSPDNEQTHLTRMLDGTLRFAGGEHVLIGGGPNSDRIRVDDGDDTILGDEGNDRIEGGAGNDGINGGDGDDILTDTFGIDNIKADEGNDVVSAGSGTGDLSFGGPGKDAIFAGSDDKEEFLGLGDDFVKGSTGISTIFGNEGDDWIEGGAHADLLQGGNGDPFQNDGALPNPADPNIAPTHTGNDVIIGDSGNDDYDSEGGDDIMVAGPGIERNEGMFGFDWVTGTRDPQAAQMDMRFTGLMPPDVDAIRDRFDLVEGLSGYDQNDILRGDDRSGTPVPEVAGTDDFTGHELQRADQISLIDGLGALLTDAGRTNVDNGNILLGGAGSDLIEGRGGNDIIDGDRWLDVELTAPGEAAPFDSITDVQSRLLSGNLNPGLINIARSIKPGAAAPDTAVFSEPRANYDIDTSTPGRVVVTHARGTGLDGEDTLLNIEVLQFSDSQVIIGEGVPNDPTTGTLSIFDNATNTVDTTPAEGQLLRAIPAFVDANGIASTTLSWEIEVAPNAWSPAPGGTGATFAPGDTEVGLRLRVRAVVIDNAGVATQLLSDPTEPVANVNDVPTGNLDIDRQDARVGRQLTASLGTVVDADGPNPLTGLSYRWQRNSTGGFVDIPDADAGDETYTPTLADLTQSLRVRATYTDAHGTTETVFSQPTLTTRNVTGGRAAVLILGRTLVPGTLAANTVARAGLSVSLTAPATTNLVRVRVFRGNAKASMARVFVKVKPGANKVTLRHGVIVNALKRGGVFRVEMTPGTSRTNLGAPTWKTITVKKASAKK